MKVGKRASDARHVLLSLPGRMIPAGIVFVLALLVLSVEVRADSAPSAETQVRSQAKGALADGETSEVPPNSEQAPAGYLREALELYGSEASETSPVEDLVDYRLVLRLLGYLVVVGGLMVATVWVLKRLVRPRLAGEKMEIIERMHLDPKTVLYLVRVGRRAMVVGASPAGLGLVTEIPSSDEIAELTQRTLNDEEFEDELALVDEELVQEGLSGEVDISIERLDRARNRVHRIMGSRTRDRGSLVRG